MIAHTDDELCDDPTVDYINEPFEWPPFTRTAKVIFFAFIMLFLLLSGGCVMMVARSLLSLGMIGGGTII